MKKLALTAIALAALTTNASAMDRTFPKWYLGLSVGVTDQTKSDFKGATSGKVDYDSGFSGSAALGYLPSGLGDSRFELEIGTRSQDIDNGTGEAKATTYALNGYYDFVNSSSLTPYIGAGLGFGNIKYTATNPTGTSGDDTQMIYQLMAGVGYETPSIPNVGFSLGYRYLAPFSDPEIGSGAAKREVEYDNHSVELGAKLRF